LKVAVIESEVTIWKEMMKLKEMKSPSVIKKVVKPTIGYRKLVKSIKGKAGLSQRTDSGWPSSTGYHLV